MKLFSFFIVRENKIKLKKKKNEYFLKKKKKLNDPFKYN